MLGVFVFFLAGEGEGGELNRSGPRGRRSDRSLST